MEYVVLIIGFFLLIKGADFFVDGSAAVAKKLGIPAVIVGLTIVSIGTSAPELAVSTISAIKGNSGIALGNVIGSNIFNALVVLGATVIAAPLFIKKESIKRDFMVCLIVSILLFVLCFTGRDINTVSRMEGSILLVLCLAYISYLIYVTKKSKDNINITEQEKNEINNIKILHKIIIGILGITGIVFGGQLVVDSATDIAKQLGMSDKLIGLTIVAMGTSLPELVTSVIAVLKGQNEIAIGNVLGSNIFNVLLILGASSMISPIEVSQVFMVDILVLISITLLLGTIIFVLCKDKVKKLNKIEGIMFIVIYIIYTIYIIMRK